MTAMEAKIDKIMDKMEGIVSSLNQVQVHNAKIYENIKFHKEAIQRHDEIHAKLSNRVDKMEKSFMEKIHAQVKAARFMGYIGTMIGGTIAYLSGKIPGFLKMLDVN